MEQLGDRIRKLRESRNMTQTELSEILGMKSYTTVSKWEKNENFPKGKDLKKLAEIFNVTSDYLLGLSDTKLGKITTQNEHPEILTIYNQLEEPKQEKVLDYAKEQLEEQNSSKIVSIFDKPQDGDYITDYVEGLVAAGHGTFQEDNLHMEVKLRAEDVPEDYDTIAKVAGDSMEPMIEDNDLLFIKVTNQVDINDIGIFQINGKNFVKKLKRDYNGGWYLQSLNNSYEEIHLTENDDIRTIGEVVSVYREK
jgi:transcriptional regulator, cro/CI family